MYIGKFLDEPLIKEKNPKIIWGRPQRQILTSKFVSIT
jgi:hypothetical protein